MIAGISLAASFATPLFQGKFEITDTQFPDSAPAKEVSEVDQKDESRTQSQNSKVSFSWLHFVPFPAGLLIFGSTLIFYIRWASRWFNRHAESELSNLQYGKDMLRASWIAELIFESHSHQTNGKPTPVEIPTFLLEQICTNLFDFQTGSKVNHPVDDIFRLAKRFKKLKINKTGVEAESAQSDGGS